MDSHEYREQLRRVNTFDAINKELDEVTSVIDGIKDERFIKLSAIRTTSSPLECIIRDKRYISAILAQLEMIKSDLESERERI